jgi:hypothetical protein
VREIARQEGPSAIGASYLQVSNYLERQIYFQAAEREGKRKRPGLAGSIRTVKEYQSAISRGLLKL